MRLIIGKNYVYDKNNIHGNTEEEGPLLCTFIGTRKYNETNIVFVFEDTLNKKQFLVEDLDLICDSTNASILRFDNIPPPIYLSDIEKLRILIDNLVKQEYQKKYYKIYFY